MPSARGETPLKRALGDSRDVDGNPFPLNVEAVDELLKAGLDIRQRDASGKLDGSGQTELHGQNDPAKLERLLRHAHVRALIDSRSKDSGSTALHRRAAYSAPAVEKLVAAGASVHLTDKKGRTALHIAAERNSTSIDTPKIVHTLITAGTLVDARDNQGSTPLHFAALKGSAATVRALIQAGADVKAVDQTGLTPLHYAALGVNADAARALLEAGAEIESRDSGGKTPLERMADPRFKPPSEPGYYYPAEPRPVRLERTINILSQTLKEKRRADVLTAGPESFLNRPPLAVKKKILAYFEGSGELAPKEGEPLDTDKKKTS